jgi:hypothetical protein
MRPEFALQLLVVALASSAHLNIRDAVRPGCLLTPGIGAAASLKQSRAAVDRSERIKKGERRRRWDTIQKSSRSLRNDSTLVHIG